MQSKLTMKEFVINLLKSKIPPTYFYHNYEHSLYVMQKAEEIGRHEKCSKKEMELLSTAALWHDTGYINIYKGHEEESCLLARKYLPGFGYAAADINSICGMIMATKIPQSPQNKLEEIIADADLAYLGTGLAKNLAHKMFKELNALNPMVTKETWNKTEIDFISAHHYFTGYCKTNKEHIKQTYLKSLLNHKV